MPDLEGKVALVAGATRGIPVQTDHLSEGEVRSLFERVAREARQLDIVVNDIEIGRAHV